MRCSRSVSFVLSAAVAAGVLAGAAPAHADGAAPTTIVYTGPSSVPTARNELFPAEVRDAATGEAVPAIVGYALRDGTDVVQAWNGPYGTTIAVPAGDYELDMAYAGSQSHAASSLTVPLTVERNATELSFARAPETLHRGDALDAAVRLACADGGPRWFDGERSGIRVELLDESGAVVAAGDPEVFGEEAIFHLPHVAAPPGTYTLRATFAQDAWSSGSSVERQVEVLRPALNPYYSGPAYAVAGDPAISVPVGIPGPAVENGRPDPAGAELTFRLVEGTTVLAEDTETAVSGNSHVFGELPVAGLAPGDGYRIEVSFPGNADFLPYADSFPFTMLETAATFDHTYDGPAVPRAGDTVSWTFRLTRADDGTPLAGQPVRLSLPFVGIGPSAFEGTATTDADGRVTMTTDLRVKAGWYHPYAFFDGAGLVAPGVASTSSVRVAAGTSALAIDAPATVPYLGSAAPTAALTEGPGRPVAGEPVTLVLTDPSGAERRRVTGTALPATVLDVPGTWRVTASYAGNAWLPPATATAEIVTTDVATTLAPGGPATGRYGDTVTFSASLSVPVAGRTVSFTLPDGTTATGTTDGWGVARVTWTVASAPGAGTVSASFAGGNGLLASSASAPFTTGWRYEFADAHGRGTVRLNPGTRDLSLSLPGYESGRVRLGEMTVRDGTVDVVWRDGTTSLAGRFELASGRFVATGTAPLPYALSAGLD